MQKKTFKDLKVSDKRKCIKGFHRYIKQPNNFSEKNKYEGLNKHSTLNKYTGRTVNAALGK